MTHYLRKFKLKLRKYLSEISKHHFSIFDSLFSISVTFLRFIERVFGISDSLLYLISIVRKNFNESHVKASCILRSKFGALDPYFYMRMILSVYT